MGIRLEQLSTGSLFFYVIDNKVSRMIKPIFALCVFIAAIQAYPFRQNQSCKMSCAPCDELVKVPGSCFCQSRPCSGDIPKCKDGQSPEPDTCNCRTCWNGAVADKFKIAYEEEAREEMVEEAENRSQ